MVILNNSELVLKLLSSFAYRAILVIYAIFLLSIQASVFEWYVYFAIGVIYVIIYINLLNKQMHFLRTCNDYLFILLILFNKDILEIYNAIFLLFPIFNSPNHLNHKRRPMLLFVMSSLVFIGNYCWYHGVNFKFLEYLFGFFLLTLLTFSELLRRVVLGKLVKIYESIDKISSEKVNSFQLSRIYNKAIEGIDEMMFNQNKVAMIVCFTYSHKPRELQIRSTSTFVLSYEANKLLKDSAKDRVGLNTPITINDKMYENTLYMKIHKYIFVVVFSKKIANSNFIYLLMAQEVIHPILEKISKILTFESALKERKYENLKQLNANLHYVNIVVKSIHFLKNKFTPIKTYFDLLDRKVPEYQRLDLQEILEETKIRAKSRLEAIESKTLQVLDKTNSPFASYTMSKMKYKHLYMLIKDIWIDNFSEHSIATLCSLDDMETKKITSNRNLLELLFTDLIENISKYASGNQTITFEYNNCVKIILQNEVQVGVKKKADLKEIVENFNRADRLEINRRSSFGLVHILELSEILQIDCKLSFDDDKYFKTTLTFKGETNETSTDI